MNQFTMSGRVTKAPEIRYSAGETTAIARFSMAVDRKFKRSGDAQTADFIPCVVFGKRAEVFEQYVKKGTKLLVQGRIETGKYENNEGATVYTTTCIVEDFEFCEKKPANPVEENNTKIAGNKSASNDDVMVIF